MRSTPSPADPQPEFPQALKLVNGAHRILVTTVKNPRGDALASALALTAALRSITKDALVVIPNTIADKWQFLPFLNTIKSSLAATRPLIIRVSTAEAAVAEVKYDEQADALFFYITPESKPIPDAAVTIDNRPRPLDLVITLGVADQDSLEELQAEDPRLLFNTPILNIDTSIDNTGYGEANIVRLTASSIAEVVWLLLTQLKPAAPKLEPGIATLLLAGLISATNNFQDSRTTPDSFQFAADLIKAGADQQAIIKNLFRTKPLNGLKLWGKAMVALVFDQAHLPERQVLGIAMSCLAPADFEETVTAAKDVAFVIDEMRQNIGRASVLGLVWQTDQAAPVNGYVEWSVADKLEQLQAKLGGVIKNHHLVFQITDKTLGDARDTVYKQLRALAG